MAETVVFEVLRTALTPTFLLVALGGILTLFAGRLARIVDRSRHLQARFDDSEGREHELIVLELRDLQRRITTVNSAILLGVLSAIVVCILIGLMFFAGLTGIGLGGAIEIAFIVAMLLLVGAFVQFLREVRLAIADIMIRDEFLERHK